MDRIICGSAVRASANVCKLTVAAADLTLTCAQCPRFTEDVVVIMCLKWCYNLPNLPNVPELPSTTCRDHVFEIMFVSTQSTKLPDVPDAIHTPLDVCRQLNAGEYRTKVHE